MESLSRLVVASTDLIEAEGRALKQSAARFLLAIGLGAVALALVLVGCGFLLYGGYRFLAQYLNDFGAALVFGVVAMGLATAALFVARSTLRK
jgi:membrane protein DedA with SNARE-associated domain